MDWANERWIKLYTRDGADWACLSFEAQALFLLLLRKVDAGGVLPLGKRGRVAVFLLLGHAHRADALSPALAELEADGCVVVDDQARELTIRNFAEAQRAQASAKQRKAAERERAAAEASKSSMFGSECHAPSRAVTDGHAASRSERLEEREEKKIPQIPPSASNDAGADAPAPPAAGGKPKRPRSRRERVLSPASVAVGDLVAEASGVRYPPASFDVLERVLGAGEITHDDALLVVQQAARDPWCLGTVRLDPTVLFRGERWPGLLAHAKAGAAPRAVKPRAAALDLYVPPATPAAERDARALAAMREHVSSAPEIAQLERWPEHGAEVAAECTSCHAIGRGRWAVTPSEHALAVLQPTPTCRTHVARSAWDVVSRACEEAVPAWLRAALEALDPTPETLALVRAMVEAAPEAERGGLLRVLPGPVRLVAGGA